MFAKRTGFIIWLNDVKSSRALEKYGTLHYTSKKMQYAVLYVNEDRADDIRENLQRLPYVKRVELSHRNEIKTEYSKDIPDKTRFYSI